MNKKTFVIAGSGLLVAAMFMLIPAQPAKHLLNDEREKASYSLGMNIATGFNRTHSDLNPDAVERGVKDALSGSSLALTPSDIKAILEKYSGQPASARHDPNWLKVGFFSAFRTEQDKVSYAFGADTGLAWKKTGMDLAPDIVAWGMKDAAAGGNPLLSAEESNESLAAFYQDWKLRRQKERNQMAEENKAKGEAFLAQNKTKQGVVSLPCGLQYKIIADGTGASPEPGNFVMLKYRGTRIDGAVFDTSDQPSVFAMGGIMKGWSEALEQMKPGSKWQLFIPPEDGYGGDGGPRVGPNETVVYELELVKVLQERPPVLTTND